MQLFDESRYANKPWIPIILFPFLFPISYTTFAVLVYCLINGKDTRMLFFWFCTFLSQTYAVFIHSIDPPQIDTSPTDQTINEGISVLLFCNASGNPHPNISWTKVGDDKVLSMGNTLNLSEITRDQDGQYKCIASNKAGVAVAVAGVTVYCKSDIQEAYSSIKNCMYFTACTF